MTEEQRSADNGAGAAGGAAREQASDALGHFWRAAHELLQAARTVIDAADQLVDEQMAAKRDEQATRIRRIDVE